MGVLHAAARRTEMATAKVQQHGFSAAAGGRRLGLVHSSTSDTRRVSLTLDPNHIRALRLKKSVITGARLHDQEAKQGSFRGAWYMLTTTYRNGSDAGPRDISETLKRVRGFFNRAVRLRYRRHRPRFRYLWVGELTKAGVPHYHVLIWIPRGIFIPKADRAGWWPHGHTKIEKARNAVGYLAKYASKFVPDMAAAFPKGFRTHAVGGLGNESKRELRWWKAPKSARDVLGALADIRKALGGYVDKITGEFWPSPWKVVSDRGRIIVWKLEIPA
ncbi:rolling circle replication-associated protein [Stenotrophomonas sp. GZD-301]|uniref:rolling circle replication-associated protein n=1 Tax=Stenotrophomonas sp. GZD-301 TaxID=3404814 RepID=UPI003BB6DD8D